MIVTLSLALPTGPALPGDSANDVEAARAAGMPVVLVPYGYTEGQDPRQWACDHMVDNLALLPGVLGVAAPSST